VGIKVLNLTWWMKQFLKNGGSESNSNPTLVEIEPVYHRDGYYLLNDMCWFEIDEKAFLYDKDSFLYDLSFLLMPVYREVEYEAMKVMKSAGLLTNELQLNLFERQFIKNKRSTLASRAARVAKIKKQYSVP